MFDDVKKGKKLNKKKKSIKSKTINYEQLKKKQSIKSKTTNYVREFKEQYQKYNAKYNANK